MRVQFVEDDERRRVTKANAWRIKQGDDVARFADLLEIGDEVVAYWSPSKEFYVAEVVELETSKYARDDCSPVHTCISITRICYKTIC